MIRIAAVSMALALVAVSCTGRRGPAAKLSAEEIVAKNAAARGGLDAWRKIQTMVWLGHIESVHAPVPGMRFELEQKRPNKTRLTIHAMADESVRVFDGVHGWELRPGHGRPDVQPYSPQELKFAETAHGIDGPLMDCAAEGDAVTLESLDELGGHQAYRLNVHRAKGGDEQVWVDAETFLETRYDRLTDGPAGEQRRVSVTYGDYRTVEGLRIPFLIETGGGSGTAPDKMQLEKVVLNTPLNDWTFGSPLTPHPRNHMFSSVATRAPTQAMASDEAPAQGYQAAP